MDIKFNGKVALVTGAGQGIGRAVAKRLHANGATVYALSKTASNLKSLEEEVPGIRTVNVDLADWDATRRAVEQVGHVDLLVNNAGIAILETFLDIKPESFDQTFNINVKAVINVSQVVAKRMIAEGTGGSIVNVSSQAAYCTAKDHAVYCTSKSALEMISRNMAVELGPHKIRVNCVNPTVVMTEMGIRNGWTNPAQAAPLLAKIPLGKFADVEEVVDVVVYMLSDRASMVHGVHVPIDGGFLAC